MSDEGLRDDISFLRDLAEAGRSRPVAGGAMLVAAGVIFGLAAFANWLILAHEISLSLSQSTIWNAAWILYLVVWTAIFLRMRSRRAAPLDPVNRVFGIAWSATGISIFVMIGAGVLAYRKLHDPVVFALFPSCTTILYGAAWFVSAAAARRYWMLWVAIGSFASALVFAAMTDAADLSLAFGIAIVAIILVPGARLMMLSKA